MIFKGAEGKNDQPSYNFHELTWQALWLHIN
jgi:hypothetical protein